MRINRYCKGKKMNLYNKTYVEGISLKKINNKAAQYIIKCIIWESEKIHLKYSNHDGLFLMHPASSKSTRQIISVLHESEITSSTSDTLVDYALLYRIVYAEPNSQGSMHTNLKKINNEHTHERTLHIKSSTSYNCFDRPPLPDPLIKCTLLAIIMQFNVRACNSQPAS